MTRLPDGANVTAPTQREIVAVLRRHPLVKLRETVRRAFVVGSQAKGAAHAESDVDILLEVEPTPNTTAEQLEERYRQALRQYFVTHNIRGKDDSIHPQWQGRRVDLYFTYDADKETRPKIELTARPDPQQQKTNIAQLRRALDFYDAALRDPKGHEVGAVRDGLEWVLKAARAVTGSTNT